MRAAQTLSERWRPPPQHTASATGRARGVGAGTCLRVNGPPGAAACSQRGMRKHPTIRASASQLCRYDTTCEYNWRYAECDVASQDR